MNTVPSHLNASVIKEAIAQAFPDRRVGRVTMLSGGLINTNLLVDFDSGEASVVLRFYRAGADVCGKEVALLNLLHPNIPVPEVLHSEPRIVPPFVILEHVAGITFQTLKRTQSRDAIQQAAASVGRTLAKIGQFQFPEPGRLIVNETGDLLVGARYIEGADPLPKLLDQFLSSTTLQQRIDVELIQRLRNFVWLWSSRLSDLERDSTLVHSDFGNRNILVREEKGKWVVAAVLDWEFAFSGSPLLDVGHFLRYENSSQPLREPHFSRSFVEHGGKLPDDWRRIVRVIDLTALVEILTHPDLPSDVETEILMLIEATLNDVQPV